MDYDEILKRMLDRVPNDLDKREGSIIYNALAPAALELATMYFTLQNNMDLMFADTAVDEYLDRICNQNGITRNSATKAIRKGLFYDEENNLMDIDINSRFSINSVVFRAVEKIETGTYRLECETEGTEGNNYVGDLIPVQYIQGLAKAQITDILIPGEDIETDEQLRQRYIESVNNEAFAGNIPDYKIKTKAIEGVGAVKVFPVWNGGGTVKLTILDSNFNKASTELVELVQKDICPNITDEGIGIAPIGHKVTVDTVEEVEINLSTTITLVETYSSETIKEQIKEVLQTYFEELRKTWEEANNLIIRISQIEARILNLSGVLDIQDTKLNNLTSNIELAINEIPIVGEVTVQ